MKRGSFRLAGWLFAFAIASGLAVLGVVATADAARGSAAAEHMHDGRRQVASASVGRCEVNDLPTATDLPLQTALVSEHRSELSASSTTARGFCTSFPPRPTFLDQVSYWTTGPPSVG